MCIYVYMELSPERFFFSTRITQSCCYSDHPTNSYNVQTLCTLYPSHENNQAHVIWHVLRAMINLLKNSTSDFYYLPVMLPCLIKQCISF